MPATNVETVVVEQIKRLLRNSNTIVQITKPLDIPGEELKRMLTLAGEFTNKWERLSQQSKIQFLNRVLTRVVLAQDCIEIRFNLRGVLRHLSPGFENRLAEDSDISSERIVKTPVQLKRCGIETRLVASDGQEPSAHEYSIKAIRSALNNAHRWNQALLDGKAKTLTELARNEQRDPRYLFDLIRLAYLAPDIQRVITKGTIPSDLTLDMLKKRIPTSWDDQRQFLGFVS